MHVNEVARKVNMGKNWSQVLSCKSPKCTSAPEHALDRTVKRLEGPTWVHALDRTVKRLEGPTWVHYPSGPCKALEVSALEVSANRVQIYSRPSFKY